MCPHCYCKSSFRLSMTHPATHLMSISSVGPVDWCISLYRLFGQKYVDEDGLRFLSWSIALYQSPRTFYARNRVGGVITDDEVREAGFRRTTEILWTSYVLFQYLSASWSKSQQKFVNAVLLDWRVLRSLCPSIQRFPKLRCTYFSVHISSTKTELIVCF